MNSPFRNPDFSRVFGTFPLRGDDLRRALESAMAVGYRAIDTAQMYENEAEIGAVLDTAGVARDELLVTTKIGNDNFERARFMPSLQRSLDALRCECVDVLLLHWPPANGEVDASLDLLNEARQRGLATHVGVSNYTAAMMQRAVERLESAPVVNQVEFHPLLETDKLRTSAESLNIPLSAYCSLARGEVFKYPVFERIASERGCTASQVVTRWIEQRGVVPIAMSTQAENQRRNLNLGELSLDDAEMAEIDQLNAIGFRICNKSLVPWAPDWDD